MAKKKAHSGSKKPQMKIPMKTMMKAKDMKEMGKKG